MHRILVDELRWVSERRFLHALNFCMLFPGPEAQQLATYIGWMMRRTLGGVMAGGFLVFALCISSYVTPALLGGGRIKVLAMLIFEQFLRVFNWPLGAAIACVLMVVTFIVMWAYNRMTAKRLSRSEAEALP